MRTKNLTYTETYHIAVPDVWVALTREECVAQFGESSVAAVEAILTQNPELTVGLYGEYSEVTIEFEEEEE